MAGKKTVKVPYSKMDYAVLSILNEKGYLKTIETKGRTPSKIIYIELNKEKPFKEVNFLSKPSVRRYRGYNNLQLRRGRLIVISTSKGIMSGDKAKKEKIGGQILLEIR